jgi:fluoride exporter
MAWGPPDVVLAIAVGGALGALARWWVAETWPDSSGGIPWSTLVVNVVGCFAIGVLLVLVAEVLGRPHRLARPFLGTGVLGGFTTFSTYAVQTRGLLAGGRADLALAYAAGTLGAAILATVVAVWLTRALTRPLTAEGGTS